MTRTQMAALALFDNRNRAGDGVCALGRFGPRSAEVFKACDKGAHHGGSRVVFFAFVLSHVPPPRFDAFWELVDHALAPHGRVAFIDNGPAAAVGEEPVSHPQVPLVRRRLRSGDQYRVVKVFHEPEELRHLLHQRGWQATVQPTGEQFYWALAHRNPPSSD